MLLKVFFGVVALFPWSVAVAIAAALYRRRARVPVQQIISVAEPKQIDSAQLVQVLNRRRGE